MTELKYTPKYIRVTYTYIATCMSYWHVISFVMWEETVQAKWQNIRSLTLEGQWPRLSFSRVVSPFVIAFTSFACSRTLNS